MQEVVSVVEVRESLDGVQVVVELRVHRGAEVEEHVDAVKYERASRSARRTPRTLNIWLSSVRRMMYIVLYTSLSQY